MSRGSAGRIAGVKGWIALCGVLLGWGALAGNFPFADDFESGTLLTTATPAGHWDSDSTVAGTTASVSAQAAHRGADSLRIGDADSSLAGGDEAGLQENFPVTTGDIYGRFWMRLTAISSLASTSNRMIVSQFHGSTGSNALDAVVSGPGLTVSVGGYDKTGSY